MSRPCPPVHLPASLSNHDTSLPVDAWLHSKRYSGILVDILSTRTVVFLAPTRDECAYGICGKSRRISPVRVLSVRLTTTRLDARSSSLGLYGEPLRTETSRKRMGHALLTKRPAAHDRLVSETLLNSHGAGHCS